MLACLDALVCFTLAWCSWLAPTAPHAHLVPRVTRHTDTLRSRSVAVLKALLARAACIMSHPWFVAVFLVLFLLVMCRAVFGCTEVLRLRSCQHHSEHVSGYLIL